MFVTHQHLLVSCMLLALPQVLCIQLRLVNSNNSDNKDKDNAYASTSENYEPGGYNYNYGVADHDTGDHKTQWEKRENGVVHGSYSVLEPDGSTRVVEYRADNTGFHPIVKKIDTPISASSANVVPVYTVNSTPRPVYSLSTSRPVYDVYTPESLLYNNQYNPREFPGNYNNDYNNGQLNYPSNNYNTPILNNGYNTGYYNRPRYTGYNGIYGGYNNDMSTLGAAAPYNLPLRPEKQPVPLLHSAYHGFDNLYH